MIIKTAWILALPMALSSLANVAWSAEQEVGNGGHGIVCYGPNNEIKSVETMDTYEGRLFYKRQIDLGDEAEDFVVKANRIIDEFARLDSLRAKKFKESLKFFLDKQTIVDVELPLTPDLGQAFPPRGCKIEQIILKFKKPPYDYNPFLISEVLWEKLSNNQKAALALHEIAYLELLDIAEGVAEFKPNALTTRYYNGVLITAYRNQFTPEQYLAFRASISDSLPVAWKSADASLECESVRRNQTNPQSVMGLGCFGEIRNHTLFKSNVGLYTGRVSSENSVSKLFSPRVTWTDKNYGSDYGPFGYSATFAALIGRADLGRATINAGRRDQIFELDSRYHDAELDLTNPVQPRILYPMVYRSFEAIRAAADPGLLEFSGKEAGQISSCQGMSATYQSRLERYPNGDNLYKYSGGVATVLTRGYPGKWDQAPPALPKLGFFEGPFITPPALYSFYSDGKTEKIWNCYANLYSTINFSFMGRNHNLNYSLQDRMSDRGFPEYLSSTSLERSGEYIKRIDLGNKTIAVAPQGQQIALVGQLVEGESSAESLEKTYFFNTTSRVTFKTPSGKTYYVSGSGGRAGIRICMNARMYPGTVIKNWDRKLGESCIIAQ